jgi:hypothetical protein
MSLPRERRIDQLLGRGQLGRDARDDVLGRVLDQVAPLAAEKGAAAPAPAPAQGASGWRQRWWRWWLPILSPVAAAAAVLLMLRLREPDPGTGTAGGFAARGSSGGARTAVAELEVLCKGRAPGTCALGGTWLFSVQLERDLGTSPLYLAAELVPSDPSDPAAGGARLWYFPDERGQLPTVDGAAGPHLLRRGIQLGPEHHPGAHHLRWWLLREPLPRDAIGQPASERHVVARGEVPLRVTP